MYSPCLLTYFHDFNVYLILGTSVPNWSISMDDKVKLTKCQNHHHHGAIFDTWTKWARPQAEWALGPAGCRNSLPGRLGFEAVRPKPCLPLVYMMRRSPSRWRPLHPGGQPRGLVGRLTTWHQTNLSKSVEVTFTPINTPLMVKVDTP
jgi:hypothetical protein